MHCALELPPPLSILFHICNPPTSAAKSEGRASLMKNLFACFYYRWTFTQAEDDRLWYPASTAYKLWAWLRRYTVCSAHGIGGVCLPPVGWHRQLEHMMFSQQHMQCHWQQVWRVLGIGVHGAHTAALWSACACVPLTRLHYPEPCTGQARLVGVIAACERA